MVSKIDLIIRPSLLLIASLIFCSFTGSENEENPQNEENQVFCEISGSDNGYEYVDLGLPSGVKWAPCNIGAKEPEEFGDYFAWGEIKPKQRFTKANSETFNKDFQWLRTKEYIDKDGYLTLPHDAANQNWGGTWRIPTKSDFDELLKYTEGKWGTINGVRGVLFTSKLNGNSLFIPAAGYQCNSSLYADGVEGFYWNSMITPDNPYEVNCPGKFYIRCDEDKSYPPAGLE